MNHLHDVKVRAFVVLAATTSAVLQLAGCSTGAGSPTQVSTDQAEALYRERCASCHDGGVPRAVSAAGLRSLSAERIRVSLTTGVMSEQGRGLSAAQLDALSRHLGSAVAAQVGQATTARCTDAAPWPSDALVRPHWNGWGADVTQRRAQTAVMAQLSAADVPRLKLKWAYGVSDAIAMAAQPAIVGGRIFIGGAKVVSLDATTGCTRWDFTPDAPVRSAMTLGRAASGAWSVYFGDLRGNVYAVDASTGGLRWRTSLDKHPVARVTGAPTLYEGRLYVPMSSIEEASSINPKYQCCTFRGSVSALDAVTGKLLWKRHTIASEPTVQRTDGEIQRLGPSGAGIWSSPTIDAAKRRLYVTTSNSYSDPPSENANAILALDLDTGALVWSKQMTANDAYTMACNQTPPGKDNCPASGGPDVDFGSSAMLLTLANGRRVLVAGQKSSVVHAVDPDRDGALLWQTRLGRGGSLGGVQWGTAFDGILVYAALSDVRIVGARADTPGAQPALGMHLRFDPNAGGGLYALDVETGKIVWQTPHPGCKDKPGCSPAQSAAVTVIPGIVFSGGLDGHLRGYDARDGRIVWDIDTATEYAATVNGVPARGGSLDGPGAVVVGGTLYVGSGYAAFGGMPGNALLAFSVDGR